MNYRSLGNGINGAVECIDTLANILALTLGTSVTQTTVPAGSKARPTDVAGCTLEMGADGLWTGNLGTLTQAQADALVAAGVMGEVNVGTRATVGTIEYSWSGSALEPTRAVTGLGFDEWVLCGDSITAAGSGWDGASGLEINGGRYCPNLSTPSIAGMQSFGRLNIARNFGFGGKRCSDLLANVGMITAGRWKNYMIQIGSNDFPDSAANISTALTAYTQFLDTVLATNPRYVVAIAIPSKGTSSAITWNLQQKQICSQRGIEFLDPYQPLNDQSTGYMDLGMALEKAQPATHPTVYARVTRSAPTLLPLIERYLGSPPTANAGEISLVPNAYFVAAWDSGIPAGWSYNGATLDVQEVTTPTPPSKIAGKVFRVQANDLASAFELDSTQFTVVPGIEYELSFYMKLIISKNLRFTFNVRDGANGGYLAYMIRSTNKPSSQNDTDTMEGVFRSRVMPTGTYLRFQILSNASDYTSVQPIDLSLAQIVCRPLV